MVLKTNCRFRVAYFDLESKRDKVFQCEEMHVENGYCIFHIGYDEESRFDQYRQEIIKRLQEKIDESDRKEQPLYCIGYFLPTLQLQDHTFHKPVYFTLAKFIGYMNCSHSHFLAGADFSGAEFNKETLFTQAEFDNHADFFKALFKDRVSFSNARFWYQANFGLSKFQKEADFVFCKFQSKAQFSLAQFNDLTRFSHAKFESIGVFSGALFEDGGERTIFDTEDLSNLSFLESDITRIRFAERTIWGEGKNDKFKLYDEMEFEWHINFRFKWSSIVKNTYDRNNLLRFLRFIGLHWISTESQFEYISSTTARIVVTQNGIRHINSKIVRIDDKGTYQQIQDSAHNPEVSIDTNLDENEAILKVDGFDFYTFKVLKEESEIFICPQEIQLEGVMAGYRALRENYEYRLRYNESGQFFIKEMELQRNYGRRGNGVIKRQNWFKRNLSPIGLYHFLALYGESLRRPTLVGLGILLGTTLFWLIQSHPSLEPHFYYNSNITSSIHHITSSTLIGFAQIDNSTHWAKAFERAAADFLPVLQLGSKVEVGLFDYVFKIVGGVLTFGLLAIALRRKFERRFRH